METKSYHLFKAAIIFNFVFHFHLLQAMKSNSYDKLTVTVGAIFGEGDENSAVYAAYKWATTRNEDNQNNKYIYLYKTVFVDDISDSFQISGAICQLLVDGVVAIIGPVHRRTMNIIRSLTNHYDILYLTISDPHIYASEIEVSRKALRIIKLRPTISETLADFIYEQKWTRMFYIYDSEDALFRLRMLFELTNAHNYELNADARMFSVTEKSNLINYIDQQSRKYAKKQIVLDLDYHESKTKIFEQLETTIANRLDFHYVLTNIDFLELNHSFLIFGGINFTAFSLVDYENENVLQFLENIWKNNIYKAHIHKEILFNGSLKFDNILQVDAALIIDGINVLKKVIEISGPNRESTQSSSDEPCTPETFPKWTASQLLQQFHKVIHFGLTGNVSFNSTGFRQRYTLNIQESRIKQNLKKIGNWSQEKGIQRNEFFTYHPTSIIHPRKNTTRLVTSILVPPFLYSSENGQYEGFCVDLIKAIAEEVNFTFIIKEVEDGSYGSLTNGSWNGMIGELISHKADLAVAPLTITSSRERVVDFSTPFMEFGLSVMFLSANQKQPDIFGFMKPLSKDIWMCIAYAYLGVSVVLFMVSRFNPHEWNDRNMDFNILQDRKISDSKEFSIFNSFWFSLSAFMQQGGDVSPKSLSGRIVGGVWWFFTLIIISSYTANLAAYLTVERMSSPIKSYEDLAKQSKIKYGVVDSGSSKEFFSKSKIDIFKKMWQFMESNPEVFVKNISMGYNKVKNSNREYAFILESTMNDYYNLQEPCTTTKVGPNLDSGKGYGIATPPGSDLRDLINLAVLELKEKNKIPELVQKWWKKSPSCNQQAESSENSITKNSVRFDDIRGLFILLLGGLGLGILLSILELIYKCFLESKRQKKSFMTTFNELVDQSKKFKKKSEGMNHIRKSNIESRVMFAI